VAQARRAIPDIHAKSAELVVVGNGNRHSAQKFVEETGLTTPLFVDTTRASYRALGMQRSLGRFIRPSAFRNVWRAYRGGYRQKGIQGDPWQLGGVLVVLTDGRVVYHHLSQVPGDHPPMTDVLAALP
jgi:hypothetical protein